MEDPLVATSYRGYDPNAAEIDGWVLPPSPAGAFASGKLLSVDLLAGFNAREFAAFVSSARPPQGRIRRLARSPVWPTSSRSSPISRAHSAATGQTLLPPPTLPES
jgi:hypothetical protein